MDAALKMLRIIRLAFLGAIVMYVALSLRVSVSSIPRPTIIRFVTLVAVGDVLMVFFLRRKMVMGSERLLASEPYDPAALARWRGGYIVTWAISLSIAIFGLLLRYLGFTLVQVSPFFVAGTVLILFFPPRRPAPLR